MHAVAIAYGDGAVTAGTVCACNIIDMETAMSFGLKLLVLIHSITILCTMLPSPYLASANAEGPRLRCGEARELAVHGMRCECVCM